MRQTHAPKPVYVTFLNEPRSTHWNLLPRGEIQEKKMLPVMAANSQLHIRASVVQVIQTLMKLCHSQIFHRGTTEWFGDGGNYWVCSFRGWHPNRYGVQQCFLVADWIIA